MWCAAYRTEQRVVCGWLHIPIGYRVRICQGFETSFKLACAQSLTHSNGGWWDREILCGNKSSLAVPSSQTVDELVQQARHLFVVSVQRRIITSHEVCTLRYSTQSGCVGPSCCVCIKLDRAQEDRRIAHVPETCLSFSNREYRRFRLTLLLGCFF